MTSCDILLHFPQFTPSHEEQHFPNQYFQLTHTLFETVSKVTCQNGLSFHSHTRESILAGKPCSVKGDWGGGGGWLHQECKLFGGEMVNLI